MTWLGSIVAGIGIWLLSMLVFVSIVGL